MKKSFAVVAGMVAALGVGCGVGMVASQMLVPAANAQQAATLPRYEYHCVALMEGFSKIETNELIALSNKLGAQHWEMTTLAGVNLCFRRQLL